MLAVENFRRLESIETNDALQEIFEILDFVHVAHLLSTDRMGNARTAQVRRASLVCHQSMIHRRMPLADVRRGEVHCLFIYLVLVPARSLVEEVGAKQRWRVRRRILSKFPNGQWSFRCSLGPFTVFDLGLASQSRDYIWML